MTREQFDSLIARIEKRFAARPSALRLRIALMLALGVAGFAFWFLVVLAVSGLFLLSGTAVNSALGFWLMLLGMLLLLLGIIQVAGLMSWNVEPVRGRVLDLREVPRLGAILARLSDLLVATRFDEVVITTEFNAGVVLLPRLGVLGLSRRVLSLGLPMLETLSPDEVEAVLAHEFAHLSARHGRFGTWIYWQRLNWERMFQRLQEPAPTSLRRLGRGLMKRFIDWFWPRFNAYAFVLSRADEYEADRVSAEQAGAGTAAAALWRIECHNYRLNDEFWPSLAKLATTQAQPPADLIGRFREVLDVQPAAADAARWTQQAALRLTDNLETHPSFSDRAKAIGQSPAVWAASGFPRRACPSAAEALLCDRVSAIRGEISALWQKQLAATWWQRHSRTQSLQQRLGELGQSAAASEAPAALWEQARASWDLSGPASAEPLLRRLLALDPAHSQGNLALGQILVDQSREEGESFLQVVLSKEDDELIPRACEILADYYRRIGRTDRLQEVRRRLGRFETAAAAAQQERSTVAASDRFVAHELSSEELAALKAVLGRYRDLKAAFLARKQMKHFVRQRLFVLCACSRAGYWSGEQAERDKVLATCLVGQIQLPGRVLIIAPHGGFRALGRRVMRVPGAQVYP